MTMTKEQRNAYAKEYYRTHRKEILQALECCSDDGYTCDGCEYFNLDFSDTHYCCDYFLKQDALVIIKRQQAEIEKARAEAIKEFVGRILSYIDVGHLRPPTEICFSDLDVKQIVEKIAKEMVGMDNESKCE